MLHGNQNNLHLSNFYIKLYTSIVILIKRLVYFYIKHGISIVYYCNYTKEIYNIFPHSVLQQWYNM